MSTHARTEHEKHSHKEIERAIHQRAAWRRIEESENDPGAKTKSGGESDNGESDIGENIKRDFGASE